MSKARGDNSKKNHPETMSGKNLKKNQTILSNTVTFLITAV